MDWLVLGFIAVETVLLALAVGTALSRGRTIEVIREIVTVPRAVDDVVPHVRRLLDRARTAEWESAQTRQDAAHLAELIGTGILRVDDDLRVEIANTAAHVSLGRPPGTMVGLTLVEAVVDDRIESIVREARETGGAHGETAVRGPDGPRLLVRARRSPLRGTWVVIEDVSELRRLQQIRAEFIDNLSHELRTPLSTVSLLAETLVRDADAAGEAIPPRMRERIGKIELETGHLVQMVNELLDLTRIESGTAVVHRDDVDMARVAVEAAERLRTFAERRSCEIVVEAAPVPLVRGDAERLGQVLVNLLHNAIKFSPDGGRIIVAVRRSDDGVVTSVTDHGIGIPPAALGRVFERFYKVDSARRHGAGTGLGLSIARHVVDQHGGRIWAESVEGRGSTFSFELPIPADLPVPLVAGGEGHATVPAEA